MAADGKILVTGATGFIGTRLVQSLVRRGCAVRALCRRATPEAPPGFGGATPLEHELVEIVVGDVTDPAALDRAAEGCSQVYHLAGYAKNWAPDRRVYHDVNVQGMLNVFEAGRRAGVERIVWTSSQITLGPARGGEIPDEDTPRASDRYLTDYEETKTRAEQLAFRAAEDDGVPVVIVNPSRVYGPGHLTEANSVTLLIDDYDRGRMPVLPNLGRNVGNWVLVEDVVEGLILAMERGRIGRRYILGGQNAALKELFQSIDRASGKRHFQVPVFRPGAMVYAYVLKKRADWLGIYPRITPGWVRTFFTEWPCSSARAERELGYRWTPLDDGVRITYEWLERVRKERR